MPTNRQQRQHTAPTCKNTSGPAFSKCQHRQLIAAHELTLLTSADVRQPTEPAAGWIPLTLLTLPARSTARNSHRQQGA